MKISTITDKNKGVIAMAILAVIILSPPGYYFFRNAFPQRVEPFLEKPDPKYKECVRDTTYMRFNHMDLLLQIRNEVVREGKVTEIGLEIGSKNCKECHTNRERFCNQCHNTVNLNPDCFGCHDYPATPLDTGASKLAKLNESATPSSSGAGN